MTGTDAAATPGALAALRRILIGRRVGSTLTVDDVRRELEASCVEGNAIGATFQRAIRLGWLQPTGAWRVSTNPDARGREVRVHRRRPIDPRGQGPHKPKNPTLPLDLETT